MKTGFLLMGNTVKMAGGWHTCYLYLKVEILMVLLLTIFFFVPPPPKKNVNKNITYLISVNKSQHFSKWLRMNVSDNSGACLGLCHLFFGKHGCKDFTSSNQNCFVNFKWGWIFSFFFKQGTMLNILMLTLESRRFLVMDEVTLCIRTLPNH